MSLLPKIKSIFPTIAVLDKIEYKFENGVVLEVPAKLVMIVTYLLVYYIIDKVSYARLLLITKQMFISIEFEGFGKANYTYKDSVKSRREIRPS